MTTIEEVFTADINPQMTDVNEKYMEFAKRNHAVQVAIYLAAKEGHTCDKSDFDARDKSREDAFKAFMDVLDADLIEIWKHLTIDKLRTMPIDISGVLQRHVKAIVEKAASQKIHSRIDVRELQLFCSQDLSITQPDLSMIPETDVQALSGGKPTKNPVKEEISEDNNSEKSENDQQEDPKKVMKSLIDGFRDVPDSVKQAQVVKIIPNENAINLEITTPDCYGEKLLGYKLTFHTVSYSGERSTSDGELEGLETKVVVPNLSEIRELEIQIRGENTVGIQEEAFTLKLRLPKRSKEIWMFGRNELNQIEYDLVSTEAQASIDANEEEEHYCDSWGKISFAAVGIDDLMPARIVCKSTTLCAVDNCELVQWGMAFSMDQGKVNQCPSSMFLRKGILVNNLAIGNAFCAVSTIDGRVFSWGDNRFGQLGQGNFSDLVEKPILVSTLDGHFVVDIKAGFGHCICLTDTGKAFTWGQKQAITGDPVCNSFGDQISFNNPGIHQPLPQDISSKYIDTDDKVVQILSSEFYLGMLTENGYLYIWGDNDYNMFGNYSASNSVIPIRLNLKGKATRASFGFDHNIVEISSTADGEVSYLAWGMNNHLQCGVAKPEKISTPFIVAALEGVKVKSFSCGVAKTFVVDENGALHVLGRKYKGLTTKDSCTLTKIKDQAEEAIELNGTLVVHF